MSQHRGNRWSDFVDRRQQLIMRYAEAVRPIVPLRRIVHVDHGRGFHPSLGRDDRSHCCENDHRRRVSRYGNSPNAAMRPALTKGKQAPESRVASSACVSALHRASRHQDSLRPACRWLARLSTARRTPTQFMPQSRSRMRAGQESGTQRSKGWP